MQLELLRQCNICESSTLRILDPDCNITQCGSCGYIFDNPRPAPDELVAFYSSKGKYDSWLLELDARDRIWRHRLRKLLPLRKPGSLLDVGTGIGQFLAIARGAYAKVYGTEVSSSAIEIARDRYGLEIFHGTIEELARQAVVFDNITLFHVLEHVHDPKHVLKTCYSLLSPGGVIAIAVPNEVSSLRAVARRILVRIGIKKRVGGKLGLPLIRLDGSIHEIHLSHFSPKVLGQLLQATGFEVISSTLDPYSVTRGMQKLKNDLYYGLSLMISTLFRVNVYDAMLMIARKNPDK